VLPAAELYYIEARDFSGQIASKGNVLAQNAQKALKLFSSEGWEVAISPVIEET
jgi:hypothetical protein